EQLVVEAGDLAQLAADLADPHVAGVGRGRDDRREAPAGGIERPADDLVLPQGDRSDVTAGRGAGVRVRRPLVRADEEDPAGFGPRGRERLYVRAHVADDGRAHGTIPALGDVAPRAARGGKGPDVDVARARADRHVRAVGRDRAAIGRPRRVAVAALAVGDAADHSVERHNVNVIDGVHLARLGP